MASTMPTISFLWWVSVMLTQWTASTSPNIIFILVDDQDVTLGAFNRMPKTKRLLSDQGLTFRNAFASSPVCCVSRSSILSGRYTHNHEVRDNDIEGNCSSIQWQQNVEPYTYAPVVEAAGYTTFYAGKYLNEYGSSDVGGLEHIPEGWTEWRGLKV